MSTKKNGAGTTAAAPKKEKLTEQALLRRKQLRNRLKNSINNLRLMGKAVQVDGDLTVEIKDEIIDFYSKELAKFSEHFDKVLAGSKEAEETGIEPTF
tara:strand:+ start:1560 stop:1853 length:294 start_codon:yes stop_codon:yes gene_type:complete